MKMIVGLGNIGDQYEMTRHNIGFRFLEYTRERMEWWEFGVKAEMKAMLLKEKELVLVKPTTMMNLSGESVKSVMNFYRVDKEDLMVVHDDLDIEIGGWKCQKGKGPKIHNGVNNIEEMIGSKDFWRVRIGIDGRSLDTRKKIPPQDYVLSNFGEDENKKLGAVFEQIFDYLEGMWL